MSDLACVYCDSPESLPISDGREVCLDCAALHLGPARARCVAMQAPTVALPADLLARLVEATVHYCKVLGVELCEEVEDAVLASHYLEHQLPDWYRAYQAALPRPLAPTGAWVIAHTSTGDSTR